MRLTIVVILWAVTGWAAIGWLLLWRRIQESASRVGVEAGSILDWSNPDFSVAFWATIGSLFRRPMFLPAASGFPWMLVVLSAIAVVVFYRHFLNEPRTPSEWNAMAALVAAPPLVGLSFGPRLVRLNFAALAEAGISHPSLVATGIAESFAPTIVGLWMALVLTIVYGVVRAKSGPQRADIHYEDLFRIDQSEPD